MNLVTPEVACSGFAAFSAWAAPRLATKVANFCSSSSTVYVLPNSFLKFSNSAR